MGDRTEEAIRKAAECACCARTLGGARRGDGWPLVAGSLSTHPPAITVGTAGSAAATWPSPDREEKAYFDAATAIAAQEGIDMLFLEMMKVGSRSLSAPPKPPPSPPPKALHRPDSA